jgi:hypothetical protein
MVLLKSDPETADRLVTRIEDLIRINVHRRIINKDTGSIIDRNGQNIDFIDEVNDDGKPVLAVYINDNRTAIEFEIIEYRLRHIQGGGYIRYLARVAGKNVWYLYVDVARGLIGSRATLQARYTSECVWGDEARAWREHKRRRKGHLQPFRLMR